MARYTLYWDKEQQKMISAEEWADKQGAKTPAHMVIQDSMNPVVHPANGKFYDSKSAFRAENKAHGLIEVGNEWAGKPWKEPELHEPKDLKPTLAELMGKH